MSYDRAELESFWQDWLDANRRAQEAGDWRELAQMYAPDATYGWSYGPEEHFIAVGREEIRDLALGQEMLGFDGWVYPYQSGVIDHVTGQVVGFWRQRTLFSGPDGRPYEIPGLGCSWFAYAGDRQWAWQRDVFDAQSAKHTVMQIIADQKVSETLMARFKLVAAGPLAGHYALEDLPAPLWPVPAI